MTKPDRRSLVFVLTLLGGCGEQEHAEFLGDTEAHERPHAEDAGAEPSNRDAAAGGEISSLGERGFQFEQGKVYIWGSLDEEHTGWEVIAALDAPNEYHLGFLHGSMGKYSQVLGDKLLYTQLYVPGIFTFTSNGKGTEPKAEVEYPKAPESNDPKTDTPRCNTGTDGNRPFKTSEDGVLIYQCRDDNWYQGSQQYFVPRENEELLFLGRDGLILVRPYAIAHADSSERKPIEAFEEGTDLRTARAIEGGFHVVISPADDSLTDELWKVSEDGEAERLGTYAKRSRDLVPFDSELSDEDELYHAIGHTEQGDIVTLSELGSDEYEIVYSEAEQPLVRFNHPTQTVLEPIESSIFVVR